jgi:hypothetical protein
MKAHIYRNIVILPADMNSSGIRWTARLDDGTRLRTDTLQSMREAIRETLDVRRS